MEWLNFTRFSTLVHVHGSKVFWKILISSLVRTGFIPYVNHVFVYGGHKLFDFPNEIFRKSFVVESTSTLETYKLDNFDVCVD